MHTELHRVACVTHSTTSLRILRALTCLKKPQAVMELAEGLELDPRRVAGEVTMLVNGGVLREEEAGFEIAEDLEALLQRAL